MKPHERTMILRTFLALVESVASGEAPPKPKPPTSAQTMRTAREYQNVQQIRRSA